MIWCERLVLLPFVVVFSAGVVCSVICPERPIVPDNDHQEKGPCTDCTSSDFTSGAKVSIEKASLDAAAGLELNSFLAPVSWVTSWRHWMDEFPSGIERHIFRIPHS